MIRHNNALTKRQLGLIMILLGLGLLVGPWLIDLLGISSFDGNGPLQRNLAFGGAITLLLGFSLLPLGRRLA